MAPHAHVRPRLVVVLSGAFEERYGSRTRECRAGTAIFRPAHEIHNERFYCNGSYISIALHPTWFVRNADVLARAPVGLSGSSERIVHLGRGYVAEVTCADSWSAVSLEGLTLELLAELGRANDGQRSAAPRWLSGVCDLIHETRDAAPSLQALASSAGVHPGHLARAFRTHIGMSVGAYLRSQRLEAARASLACGDCAIAEIVATAGFYDQAHLSRCFKRAYGFTPSRYRASHRAVRPRR